MKLNIIRYGNYLVCWLRLASSSTVLIPIIMPVRQALYYLESLGQATSLVDFVNNGLPLGLKGLRFALEKVKQETFSKAPTTLDRFDRYGIYKKILQKRIQDTNSLALRDSISIQDLQRDEINAGFGIVTNVQIIQVAPTTDSNGECVPGSIGLEVTIQHPESTEAVIETFVIQGADLENAMMSIIQALAGDEISFPITYKGSYATTLQRDFRDPPSPGAGSSGSVTANFLLTDSVLHKTIPECFIGVNPSPSYFKTPPLLPTLSSLSSLSSLLSLSCFGFLGVFILYCYYFLKNLKK